MKKVGILMVIILISYFKLMAQQESCSVIKLPNESLKFYPPKLLDSSLFNNDLRHKISLKHIYDHLKKDTVFGSYMYSFSINKQGKLIPGYYYDKNNPSFSEIHEYVINTFNNFKWEPGYKENCKDCKETLLMQLVIYFETDEENIRISLKYIELPQGNKTVFSLNLPYEGKIDK